MQRFSPIAYTPAFETVRKDEEEAIRTRSCRPGCCCRRAAAAHFAGQGEEWELRVQLCTDLDRMPIEDASKEWPEELSPYAAVARLIVEPQRSRDPVGSKRLEDETAFDPWNCVAAHRPLGAIDRARREVMKVSREARASFNGCPIHEPSR